MLSLNSIKTSSPTKGFRPKLIVFGVGGAGGNAINNMIRSNLEGVDFYAINTDAQALEYSLAENKIQIGKEITGGLGAGAIPEIGKKAVEEAVAEMDAVLDGANMLFITAGMGGGTGTGAAPAIAEMAKSRGILTVAVVTKPFDFEGKSRQRIADQGIAELKKHTDTLIVVPNQNLFRIVNERTSFVDAFKIADEVLYSGVKCITDLITMPGLVNLDFADVRTVMKNMGRAMMSSGESSDEDRAIKAAELAIVNPLLDIASVDGAKGVLINITGGSDMTLFEVNDAVEKIRSNLSEDSNIIFGAIFNEKYDGLIRVSVVATGVGNDENQAAEPMKAPVKSTRAVVKEEKAPVQTDNLFANAQNTLQRKRQQELVESRGEVVVSNVNYEEDLESEDDEDFSLDEEANVSHRNNQQGQKFNNNNDDIDELEGELDDGYSLGKIEEPSISMMHNKIKKYNGVEPIVTKKIDTMDAKHSENSEGEEVKSPKRGGVFGKVVSGVLFGTDSANKPKKKVNKSDNFSAVDIFEDEMIGDFDSQLNSKRYGNKLM